MIRFFVKSGLLINSQEENDDNDDIRVLKNELLEKNKDIDRLKKIVDSQVILFFDTLRHNFPDSTGTRNWTNVAQKISSRTRPATRLVRCLRSPRIVQLAIRRLRVRRGGLIHSLLCLPLVMDQVTNRKALVHHCYLVQSHPGVPLAAKVQPLTARPCLLAVSIEPSKEPQSAINCGF